MSAFLGGIKGRLVRVAPFVQLILNFVNRFEGIFDKASAWNDLKCIKVVRIDDFLKHDLDLETLV